MSDLPTSITARVQNIEDCIAAVRSSLRELEAETDKDTIMSVLIDLTAQLAAIRSNVDDVRSLVRYS